MSDNHLRGKLQWDPRQVCGALGKLVPKPKAVTVCSSVWGGYLPVMFRFIPDACFEYSVSGKYPPYAVELLDAVTTMRTNPGTLAEIAPPRNTTFRPSYEYFTGLCLLTRGQPAQALRHIESAAEMHPVYLKGLLDAAETFVHVRRPQAAHNVIDRFEELAGAETLLSLSARVRTYIASRDLDKADRASRRLVGWTKDAHFLILRGGVLAELNRFEEAETVYRQALQATPLNAVAHYNLGVVLERQHREDDAIRSYQAAVKIRADFADAEENLGYLLLKKDRLADAVKHLEAAIRINPLKVTAVANLGLALDRQGKPEKAVEHYRAALRINPKSAEVHFNLASTLLQLRQLDEAAEHAREALKLKPGWKAPQALLEHITATTRQ
jgi:tetratricopeptide (TPR) repeat protein